MFLAAAIGYTLTQLVAAGGGGAAVGIGVSSVYHKYKNRPNSNKEELLKVLEEDLLTLYQEMPSAAKKFTLNTTQNAQNILDNSKDIFSKILADEKVLSEQLQALDTHSLNLDEADKVLKAFVKLITDNLEVIKAELINRNNTIEAYSNALIDIQGKMNHATVALEKAVEKQEKLEADLAKKTDDYNNLAHRVFQLDVAPEQSAASLSSELLQSKQENAKLQAENARLREMIIALQALPQQEIIHEASENISSSPRM